MIDKVTNLAERLATNVSLSRRGFLGRLGQGALAVAGVLGGLLVFPKDALGVPGSYVCCIWHCNGFHGGYHVHQCLPAGSNCYSGGTTCFYGGKLQSQKTVASCSHCS